MDLEFIACLIIKKNAFIKRRRIGIRKKKVNDMMI